MAVVETSTRTCQCLAPDAFVLERSPFLSLLFAPGPAVWLELVAQLLLLVCRLAELVPQPVHTCQWLLVVLSRRLRPKSSLHGQKKEFDLNKNNFLPEGK